MHSLPRSLVVARHNTRGVHIRPPAERRRAWRCGTREPPGARSSERATCPSRHRCLAPRATGVRLGRGQRARRPSRWRRLDMASRALAVQSMTTVVVIFVRRPVCVSSSAHHVGTRRPGRCAAQAGLDEQCDRRRFPVLEHVVDDSGAREHRAAQRELVKGPHDGAAREAGSRLAPRSRDPLLHTARSQRRSTGDESDSHRRASRRRRRHTRSSCRQTHPPVSLLWHRCFAARNAVVVFLPRALWRNDSHCFTAPGAALW